MQKTYVNHIFYHVKNVNQFENQIRQRKQIRRINNFIIIDWSSIVRIEEVKFWNRSGQKQRIYIISNVVFLIIPSSLQALMLCIVVSIGVHIVQGDQEIFKQSLKQFVKKKMAN
ncbi:hypothetical protein DW954_02105 [Clostridium sp. AM45-5]|nr:hypothetical protein DW954_02105 [Clostridium sp. AM45-5]